MSHRHVILAALAASLAASHADPYGASSNQTADPGPKPPVPGPADGRMLRVPADVFAEVMRDHTIAEVNAMPYEQRVELAEAAARRLAERERQSSNEAGAQLRAERERRKAEAWAKRQPKGKA